MLRISSIGADERGVAAIEYALIAAMIALAVIGGMVELGVGVGSLWGDVVQKVQDAM